MTKEERKQYSHTYYQVNKGKILHRTSLYYKANKQNWADRYQNNKETLKKKAKEYWPLRTYGLSFLDIDTLLQEQNHRCAICGCLLKEKKRCIDHNHITGKIRGILCGRCNTGLWSLEDLEYRNLAEKYLARTNEKE